MRKILSVIILSLFVVGCVSTTSYLDTGVTVSGKNPDAAGVRLYEAPPAGDYEVLGSVAADGAASIEQVRDAFKEKVAEMGGNAAIYVKLSKMNTMASARNGISGVAIRMK